MKSLCSQVSTQKVTTGSYLQLGNGFVFYLPYSFPGQVVFFANILQAKGMIHADTKEKADHIFLPFSKGAQRPVYFSGKGICKGKPLIGTF